MFGVTRITLKSITALFEREKATLYREGFLSFSKSMLCFFTRLLLSHSVIYLYENSLAGARIPCEVDGLTLRVITSPEEFDKLLVRGGDLPWYRVGIKQCRKRLSKGTILFCALIDGEVAHLSWVGVDNRTHGDFHTFLIDYEHEGSIGDSATNPRYRRKGIYTYVYSEIFQYIREGGRSKAMIEINKDNMVAQMSQAKLGSNIWGEGHCLRLLLLFNFRWVKPYT